MPEVAKQSYDQEPVPWLADCAREDSSAAQRLSREISNPSLEHYKHSLDQVVELFETLKEEHERLKQEHDVSLLAISALEEDRDITKRALDAKLRELRLAHLRIEAQDREILHMRKHMQIYCGVPYQPLSLTASKPKRKEALGAASSSSALHALPAPTASTAMSEIQALQTSSVAKRTRHQAVAADDSPEYQSWSGGHPSKSKLALTVACESGSILPLGSSDRQT